MAPLCCFVGYHLYVCCWPNCLSGSSGGSIRRADELHKCSRCTLILKALHVADAASGGVATLGSMSKVDTHAWPLGHAGAHAADAHPRCLFFVAAAPFASLLQRSELSCRHLPVHLVLSSEGMQCPSSSAAHVRVRWRGAARYGEPDQVPPSSWRPAQAVGQARCRPCSTLPSTQTQAAAPVDGETIGHYFGGCPFTDYHGIRIKRRGNSVLHLVRDIESGKRGMSCLCHDSEAAGTGE